MTERGKTFLAEASRNEELKAKLLKIDRSDMKAAVQEAIKLAKSYGYELIEDDLTMDKASVEGVMDDDALDVVAGGRNYIIGDFCEDGITITDVCCCLNGLGVEDEVQVTQW